MKIVGGGYQAYATMQGVCQHIAEELPRTFLGHTEELVQLVTTLN